MSPQWHREAIVQTIRQRTRQSRMSRGAALVPMSRPVPAPSATLPSMRSSGGAHLVLSLLAVTLLMCAVAGCATSGQSRPITESSSHKPRTALAAQAAYTGPSWSEYIKTQPGQSCVLVGDEYHVAGSRIAGYLTQAVVSSTKKAGGERVLYRMTTRVTDSEPGATVLPPISYLLPYEIQADGKLGTSPGLTSEPGLKVEWNGSELYPTIDELRAGKSAVSSVVLSAKVTETAGQRALEKELEPGQTQMKVRFKVTVSPAPVLSSVHTPDGAFTNLVGVKTQMGSGEALNASPAYAAKFAQLVSAFGKAFSNTMLYYAKGIGMVASDVAGSESKLQRCSG